MKTFKKVKGIMAVTALGGLILLSGCTSEQPQPVEKVIEREVIVEKFVCPDGSQVDTAINCPVVQDSTPFDQSDIDEAVSKVTPTQPSISVVDGWSEEYFLGETLTVTLKDNKVAKLIDDKIEFDGNDYNVHEEIEIKDTQVVVSEDGSFEELELEAGLATTAKKAITYSYKFDDNVDIDDIDEETPLEILFLGKPLKITDVSDDSFTVSVGSEYFMSPTDVVDVNGKKVSLVNVYENGKAIIDVDGVSESMDSGETEKINGVEIYLSEVFYTTEKADRAAEIIIGSDVKQTIDNGDSLEILGQPKEESDAEWVGRVTVDGDKLQAISVEYNQKRDDADKADEWPLLRAGDSIVLPNDYLTVKFAEVSEPKEYRYELEIDNSLLYIQSDETDAFVKGSEEYKEVWVDATGIYEDEDKVTLIDAATVDLFTSEVCDLTLTATHAKICDLEVKFDMSQVKVSGVDVSSRDESILTSDGVKLDSPESAVDDKDNWEITVPDEAYEATVKVYRNNQ